eukprot:m.436045 g.436045  ORF g.436045 m.436045 type:complete len:118 (+) comp20264_c0_seq26:1224-1577(+)
MVPAVSVMSPWNCRKDDLRCGRDGAVAAGDEGGVHHRGQQAGHTALLRAAIHCQLETVQWLLEDEGGASDNCSNTALLLAVCNEHLATVQWLLGDEGGASITEKENMGLYGTAAGCA